MEKKGENNKPALPCAGPDHGPGGLKGQKAQERRVFVHAMAAHKPAEWVQAVINRFDEQVRRASRERERRVQSTE